MAAVRFVSGPAMEIEANLPRVIVDINIGRSDMVDEITICEIEHARFMHLPRAGDGIRNREANIGPIVMREVEVIPAKWIRQPIGHPDK